MSTLVLGASLKEHRYSNRAIRSLQENGHDVVAVGNRTGQVGNVEVQREMPRDEESIDTVTLYLSARNQEPYEDRILDLSPRRIIFNPGAENDDLAEKARARGIEPLNACTLVMLATDQY